MIGAGVHLYIYRAVCRNFAKWGEGKLGVFKKEVGDVSASSVRGSTGRQC